MKYKIIKDKNFLHKKTELVSSLQEGEEIAAKLIEVINEQKFAIGLSANQIGILKRVSVIRARKDVLPIILINPTIVDRSAEKIQYFEGCLSLPNKHVKTIRNLKITVSTLNHANPMPFGPDVEPITQESVPQDYGILEAVCVQHEIDHLDGILMTDPSIKVPTVVQKVLKHGRNDKVVVEKNGETQYIKYKKALELVNSGWKII
jgi:peptide deformylase